MKTWFVLLASGGKEAPPLIDIDGTLFVQFGIFIVLLLILTKLVFRPYLELIRERGQSIDGAKDEAQHDNTLADEDLVRYEDQLQTAKKDAAKVRAQLRSEGEQEATDLLAQARDESEARIQSARDKIDRSAQAAKLSLRTRADQIAQSIATKLMGREV